jgi:hypothetical protein
MHRPASFGGAHRVPATSLTYVFDDVCGGVHARVISGGIEEDYLAPGAASAQMNGNAADCSTGP